MELPFRLMSLALEGPLCYGCDLFGLDASRQRISFESYLANVGDCKLLHLIWFHRGHDASPARFHLAFSCLRILTGEKVRRITRTNSNSCEYTVIVFDTVSSQPSEVSAHGSVLM